MIKSEEKLLFVEYFIQTYNMPATFTKASPRLRGLWRSIALRDFERRDGVLIFKDPKLSKERGDNAEKVVDSGISIESLYSYLSNKRVGWKIHPTRSTAQFSKGGTNVVFRKSVFDSSNST